jgi:hypothetical protein
MKSTEQEEKIMTLNLNGKKGVNISKQKYELMKDSILKVLKEKGEVTLTELNTLVESDLGDSFDGRVGWYLMAVKLDLEVREIIVKVPNQTPQRLALVN